MESDIILSICIPTYNRRDLVCENVRKILQYKGNDIEVIVNDNASEDGTVEALKEIKDRRLKIYQNEMNIGANGNYIRVLMHAAGKYIVYINDRDYLEHEGIQEFVSQYGNRECDVVMGIDKKEIFDKRAQSIGGKVFLLLYFNHPGLLIMGRRVSDKLLTRIQEKKLTEYDDKWRKDIFSERFAICIYARKWECIKQMVRTPNPDQLAHIVQLRGETDEERLFFTPEGQMYRFSRHLNNPYIHSDDMEEYISAVYRFHVFGSLSLYYQRKDDPCTKQRYNYEPETSICWIKMAINLCRDALVSLKEMEMWTFRLNMELWWITAEEYVRLCKIIAIKMKKKVFPKPWFR